MTVKPRRCHRGQARSHNDPASREFCWPCIICGSWLACDASDAVCQVLRGDAIAGKPAPTTNEQKVLSWPWP
ncbi:hypothetical protein CJU73_10610 [Pseudomonas fragi]|nr:hypothetical protein CJU73_10610 [Pseudomonas fragi]